MLSVAHNMMAMNAQRMYGQTSISKSKTTEKLASGYRINRAADDAAGLTISEKMRSQIRGLNQGTDNCQAGVSMCQVAEGALAEVNDMLHRLTELTVKASNGTLTPEDRQAIQKEINQITSEIERISNSTEFNTRPLFKGDVIPSTSEGGTTGTMIPTCDSILFSKFGSGISNSGYMEEPLRVTDVTKSTSEMSTDPSSQPYVSVHMDMSVLSSVEDIKDTSFYVNCCTNCCPTVIRFKDSTGIKWGDDGSLEIGLKKNATEYFTPEELCKNIVDKAPNISHVEFAYNGSTLYLYDIDNFDWTEGQKKTAYFCDEKSPYFKPGTTPGSNYGGASSNTWIHSGPTKENGFYVSIDAMNTQILGIKGLDVTTQDNAKNAIDDIAVAQRKVSANRSKIGAQQNRLESSIRNNENISENTQAAESRIRDTDMAAEMVKLSMMNILQQAGEAMMSQANQSTQGVLNLLQ